MSTLLNHEAATKCVPILLFEWKKCLSISFKLTIQLDFRNKVLGILAPKAGSSGYSDPSQCHWATRLHGCAPMGSHSREFSYCISSRISTLFHNGIAKGRANTPLTVTITSIQQILIKHLPRINRRGNIFLYARPCPQGFPYIKCVVLKSRGHCVPQNILAMHRESFVCHTGIQG